MLHTFQIICPSICDPSAKQIKVSEASQTCISKIKLRPRKPEPEYFTLRIKQIYVWKRKDGKFEEKQARIHDNIF
jgi:hypothetical protein